MLPTMWNVTEKVTSKYSDENLFSVTEYYTPTNELILYYILV